MTIYTTSPVGCHFTLASLNSFIEMLRRKFLPRAISIFTCLNYLSIFEGFVLWPLIVDPFLWFGDLLVLPVCGFWDHLLLPPPSLPPCGSEAEVHMPYAVYISFRNPKGII